MSESAEPTKPVVERRGGAKLAPFIGLGLLAIIPMVLLIECGSSEGQMTVTGGPHGDFVFTATDCHALQPYGRFGANVHGDGHNDGAVYVTGDPLEGTSVTLEVPGSCRNANGTDCTVFAVPREQCTTFEANVENTNTTVNDVRLVRGHAELDCTLDDGTVVRGRVDFDGC